MEVLEITETEQRVLDAVSERAANVFLTNWGRFRPRRSRDNETGAIRRSKLGLPAEYHRAYSTSEMLTIYLALGRHDLLFAGYRDPVSAWRRLDSRQRAIVRREVGAAPWMQD
jgi:hypothetical protein